WRRLVCVHGEANAWPHRDPVRQEPETIHWVAHLPAEGATYESVVAPRRPLGPATPAHVDLPSGRILAGACVEDWHRTWLDFARADDILVVWGTYYRDLAARDGLHVDFPTLDLRREVSNR